jgi:hypothetical protein
MHKLQQSRTKNMKRQGSMTPSKVHNSSKSEPKDIEMVAM